MAFIRPLKEPPLVVVTAAVFFFYCESFCPQSVHHHDTGKLIDQSRGHVHTIHLLSR